MNEKEKLLIADAARIFSANRDIILHIWLGLIRENKVVDDANELEYFKAGFVKLIDDFILYLSTGDFNAYYSGNAAVARKIAFNEISYGKFIEAFHFFEDSYYDLLRKNLPVNNIFNYIGAIDKLHHRTIAVVSEAYFEIKDSTIFALVKLTEYRDPETGFHLERTRKYSAVLAKKLRCDNDFVSQIYKAAPLHDIGKIGIRDSILLKPGPLTSEEYEDMKKHTMIGSETLAGIIKKQGVKRGSLLMGVDITSCHHEKYNGNGYPFGLKGEEIPLSARIFTLADAYDAIVSKRPYKPELPHEEAVRRIATDIGKHFDPRVANAFLAINGEFRKVHDGFADAGN